MKSLGFANHGLHTVQNCHVKFGLLAWLDMDVGEFENHGFFWVVEEWK
jgi:hypothetical protein